MKFVPNNVTRFVSRQKLQLDANSPSILLGVGIVGVVGATVLACRATLKAQPILEATHLELEAIEYDAMRIVTPDSEKRQRRVHVYGKTTVQLLKLYGPAVVIGGVSVACLVQSNRILTERYSNLGVAYIALQESIDAYRKRVAAEIGDEKEHDLYYAGQDTTYLVPGPNGPKKEKVRIYGDGGGSPYARLFNRETSTEYRDVPEWNHVFLRQVEQHCNTLLRAKGHLFLNRVFEELGMEDTEAGAVVGWLYERGIGDDQVDFGIWSDGMKDRLYDFMVGNENEIMLDFNVAGPIHKLLNMPKVR